MALPHPEDRLCLVVVEKTDDDCSQPQIVGGQAKALGRNSQIEHEPVPELRSHLAFVIPGALQLGAEGEDNRGLVHGL